MAVWKPGDTDMPDEVRAMLERLDKPKSSVPLPVLKVPPPLPVGSAKLYTMKNHAPWCRPAYLAAFRCTDVHEPRTFAHPASISDGME